MTAEVAWRLFIEHGYDNVTVQDICAVADIAPRTFHRYFASKDDVVSEPMRRMAAVVHEAIASAPAAASDAETMRHALLRLGQFVIDHAELLTALRIVARQSHQLRVTYLGVRPDQDGEIAARLAARRPGDEATGWRLRLLVACSVAGFRIWYDDYFGLSPADPLAHLERILAAVERGTTYTAG